MKTIAGDGGAMRIALKRIVSNTIKNNTSRVTKVVRKTSN